MQTKENSEEGSKETENHSWGNFAEGPWWAVVSHLSMALRQTDRELTQSLSSQSPDEKSILVMVRRTQDLYFGLNYTI